MRLLYLDDSGSLQKQEDRYIVLAGYTVNERRTHWIEKQLNDILLELSPLYYHGMEFHGTQMRGGRAQWHKIGQAMGCQALKDALSVVTQQRDIRLFAAVVDRHCENSADEMYHILFEQISVRFDKYLSRINRRQKIKERGIMILDKAKGELDTQLLALKFKHEGHRWERLKNMAEVPLFLDSKSSRLIQLADLIAFAVYRFYQHADNAYYNIIRDHFDRDGKDCHGLWVQNNYIKL